MPLGVQRARLWATLAWLACCTRALAQEAPQAEPEPQPAEAPADPGAELRTRAAQIRALVAGTLDPAVDLESLLRLDLTDPALGARERWLVLLREPKAPPRRKPWQKPPPPATGNREDLSPEDDLQDALRALLFLPAEARTALLDGHRARQQALEAERTRQAREAAELERLRLRGERLQAFLAGELDPALDPRGLLALDLATVAAPDLGARLRNLARLLERRPPDAGEAPSGAAAAPDAGVGEPRGQEAPPVQAPATAAEARARIDDLLSRYLSLSPQARDGLFTRHAARQAQAAEPVEPEREQQQEAIEAADRARAQAREAAEKRKQALEAARQARSNSLRLLEEERARLHAIEERQAREEELLSKARARHGQHREDALAWTERVDTLARSSSFGASRARDAERLHGRIGSQLGRLHKELDRALFAVVSGPATDSGLGERFDDAHLHEEHRGQLDALWSKLVRKDEQLRALDAGLQWERTSELRDAIVALNTARLQALSLSGEPHRAALTGTGPDGVAAARGELTQVGLELRYHLLELPRHIAELRRQLGSSPWPVVWGGLQLLLILFIFRAWRRHADAWLTRLRRTMRQRVLQSWGVRFLASFAWYLRRIHRPLDWLVLLWVVLGTSDVLPELRFVRLVLVWLLSGSMVVLLLDAMASRQHRRGRRGTAHGPLRLRSLRLVGLTVVVLGLLLSLTEASVGRGTIYAWALMLCWMVAVPLALLLVSWWRAIIFENLDALGPTNRLAAALARSRDGATGVLAAPIGGVYLLGTGLLHWARDHIYEFELMRRLLAYLLRNQVVRQSRAAEGRSGRPESLVSEVQARFFRPEAAPARIVDYATDPLADVATWVCDGSTTLTAVVGERGRGKSTFLTRLRERIGDERVMIVACPHGKPEELLAALAEELSLGPSASDAQVAEALRTGKPRVVCIDDAQRLVRPTIEGLEQLDRLEDLARAAGGGISWVLAIDAPAWSFIQRAYGDRVSFDHVVELPAWTETQLGELIRATTEKAGLEPVFDDLMARRQLTELEEEDEERLEQSFYRIIWDSSDGNASVALRYWRHSLFQDPDGRVAVRMFDEPPAAEVDQSPLTVLFVLRSLLQMDVAERSDLVDATNLTPGQVHNALRFAEARGFVEEDEEESVRVSWSWYRPITRVLRRRRLLVM